MQIKYALTEDDYIKFNTYHILNSSSHKRSIFILRYILSLFLSFVIFTIGTSIFKQPKLYWIIVSLLFLIIWIVTYPKQLTKLIHKETQKLLNEKDNSEFLGNKSMIINDDSITIHNNSSSETFLKSSIKEVNLYEDIVILYTSSISAHIISCKCIDTDELINNIKNTCMN